MSRSNPGARSSGAVSRAALSETPLCTRDELASAGVAIQLFPLSAFRAMNKAAENMYASVRRDGHQKAVVETMRTREELYGRIDHHAFEDKLDRLFARGK